MSDAVTLPLAWISGVLLGALFFGGLWWTVGKGVSSGQPALWFFGSLVVRMSVVLVGFYLTMGGRWERLLSCLSGFVIASLLVTRWTRARNEQEASHAPDA